MRVVFPTSPLGSLPDKKRAITSDTSGLTYSFRYRNVYSYLDDAI